MQRWWLIVAGVVGIGLAVLLVPRPDTGGDVPEVDLTGVEVPELPPIRENETLPLRRSGDGTSAGTPTTGGGALDDRARALMEPQGVLPNKPDLNPKAARVAARRDTPEARYAAKAMGPWTQVRRLLSIKQADEQTVETVEGMVDDLRTMFRDPTTVDASEMEQKQVELIEELRGSPDHDEEIEKMLTLIETRLEEYHADRDGAE